MSFSVFIAFKASSSTHFTLGLDMFLKRTEEKRFERRNNAPLVFKGVTWRVITQ